MRFPLRLLPIGARLIGAGAWLPLAAACSAVSTFEPAELSPSHVPTRVWVTLANDSTLVFDHARVSGDTLIGEVSDMPERLPLSQATVLRFRKRLPDRTAALVFFGGGAVAIALIMVDITAAHKPQEPSNICHDDCPL